MARLKGCLLLIVAFLVFYLLGNANGPQSSNLPTIAVLPSLTWTPESAAIQVTEAPGVTIIPTVVVEQRVSSGFITITPAPGTIYPTATITDTLMPTLINTDLPTATPAPQLTPIELQIYFTVSAVNLRSCPSTTCAVVEKIPAGAGLAVSGIVNGEEVNSGNPYWYKVEHSYDEEYAYSRFLSLAAPDHLQPNAQVIATNEAIVPVPQSGFVCPRNCTDARAMGLTSEQAATCPGLDRDGDHQACYADN